MSDISIDASVNSPVTAPSSPSLPVATTIPRAEVIIIDDPDTDPAIPIHMETLTLASPPLFPRLALRLADPKEQLDPAEVEKGRLSPNTACGILGSGQAISNCLLKAMCRALANTVDGRQSAFNQCLACMSTEMATADDIIALY